MGDTRARPWGRRLHHAVFRQWYYLAMYSGVRALINRVRSHGRYLEPRLLSLHGRRFGGGVIKEALLQVHPRRRPARAGRLGDFGLFSLRLLQPPVDSLADQYFRSTSHFGCGHVEVAFYEHQGAVTVYAIRNIAEANARRLGLVDLAARFRLSQAGEEGHVLRATRDLLEAEGFRVAHAPAQLCLDLAVDDRLLPLDAQSRAREILRRKYERLSVVLEEARA